MTAVIKLRDKQYEVKAGSSVREAMLSHDIQPDSVIPTRDGELITDDEIIQEGDTIRLVEAISGGFNPAKPCGTSTLRIQQYSRHPCA
jgi:sulfur carrier protein ThiS